MSGRKKKILVHSDYIGVYNQLLHLDEVIDIELTDIYNAYEKVIQTSRSEIDLTVPATKKSTQKVIQKVLRELGILI